MTASVTLVSSARRRGIAPGREALAAALLFAAGLGIRLALTGSVSVTGDGPRFLAQAGDLQAGAAYVIPQDPFSTLPPGYPLFIRAVGLVAGGVDFLRRVQLVLSLLTLLLVWLAARRRSREGALVALALLALNPWLAREQSLVMSETLGAFLVAAAVFLWPAPARPLGRALSLALGVLAAASFLVTPAAAFVALPVLAVLAWRGRQVAVPVLATVGVLLVVAPWQLYLVRTTGRMEPLLLHPLGTLRTGLQAWLRTWSTTPSDKDVWWSADARRDLPDRALGEGAERGRVREALDATPVGVPRYAVGSPYDEILRTSARERIAEHPVLNRAGLPLVRGATLWLDYRKIIGIPGRFRDAGGVLSAAYWAAHAVFWTANLATLGLFAWGAVRALKSRDAVLLGLVAGAVAYSLVSAAPAVGEFRRNLTLLPALVLLVCADSSELRQNRGT
jgi:hypothetical protein